MKDLDEWAKALERLKAEAPKAESGPLPPAAPDSWSWSHVAIDESGASLQASRAAPFDRGCADCFEYGGLVPVPGEPNTLTDCRKCRDLVRRVDMINRAGLPAKFFGRRFDWSLVSVDGGENPEGALTGWVDHVARWRNGTGAAPPSLAFFGATGRGKSHCAFVLAQRAIDCGVSVRWIHWSHLKTRIMSKREPQDHVFFGHFPKRGGVIFVDEFGVGSPNDWACEIACAFLESLPPNCVIVATSNAIPFDDSANGLVTAVGDRAASRLSGLCGQGDTYLIFSGVDHRRKR